MSGTVGLTGARRRSTPSAGQIVDLFLSQVAAIPGVLEAKALSPGTPEGQPILVRIQRRNLDAERRVYSLEGEMYDQHPDARLEVLIEEADEPGCRAEDLSSV